MILSQRNACPQNMVLQISCRCLREVDNAHKETALIWLNKFNAEKLNQQLREQQYTTIAEFGGKKPDVLITLRRYSRMERLKLPPIDYYQIKISYNTIETTHVENISEYLRTYQLPHVDSTVIYTQGFDQSNTTSESAVEYGMTETANFRLWLDLIVKESFGLLPIDALSQYEDELKGLFDKITVRNDENLVYDTYIDQSKVRSDIRNSFAVRRSFTIEEELVHEDASLLKISPSSPIEVSKSAIYVPSQEKVEEIVSQDSKPAETISVFVNGWCSIVCT